ncbi:MAG: glutaminase A [Terracoccus sp.]
MSSLHPLHDSRDTVTGEQAGAAVSTGRLPSPEVITASLTQAYERYGTDNSGLVADYIPALADVDPDLFGIAVVGAGGVVHTVGDAAVEFSIQSISKAFVFALVDEALGHETVRERVGVNNTGLPFNSMLAIELNGGSPSNPMVNAGALAATSLVPGESVEARWQFILEGISRFAGRPLEIDQAVYSSESASNQRNQAIAWLLDSYDRLNADPAETTDIYTRQCSLLVSATDLAVMGATLAAGGMNPLTGEQVVSPTACRDTLAVLAASGLYERSGDWLYEIGMPGKSGVSGGIVTIAPGKGGLGTFSPRLDAAGNSVRGQRAAHYLSDILGLNLFGSAPTTEAMVVTRPAPP